MKRHTDKQRLDFIRDDFGKIRFTIENGEYLFWANSKNNGGLCLRRAKSFREFIDNLIEAK